MSGRSHGARDYKVRRRKPGGGFSGWTGVGVGLALGLAVAVGVYIRDHRPETAPGLALASTPTAKAARKKGRGNDPLDAGGSDAAAPEEPQKSYSFYDMLPKFEVVVPEKDREVKHDVRPVPETRRGAYVLQAGSYKNAADAERVHAQLALQGIESKVQKVTVDNESWERVRIGPLTNLDELNRTRDRLRKADIDVLVIRVGD